MATIYSVSQMNTYIKNMFVNDYLLKAVQVKGEVSNCKYHSSGHIYFTLKDMDSSIHCVMFKGSRKGLSFQMKDGQGIIITGSISVYERDGRYQIYATDIKQDGQGLLYEEYERLKQKLYEEGLFDFEHKKEIPKFAKKVGIVTALTGAAIEDIKNIAKRRNPCVQLILYPAKVQGEGAAKTIVEGIQTLDKMGLDTIIIGRGGGSIEDLWAFNEECVARAIYHAETPIISGTGHEIDNTIADYVADSRAPTPSAACEIAVYDMVNFEKQLQLMSQRLDGVIINRIKAYQNRFLILQMQLKNVSPMERLSNQKIYLDELSERLRRAMAEQMQEKKYRFEILWERLNGLSPLAKLKGGYGYIEYQGKPLQSAKRLKKEDEVKITIHDGKISAKIIDVFMEE